jgi:hypothetical protein
MVGIVVGVISAIKHDWLTLFNVGGGYIFIEAVVTFLIHYTRIYKLNKSVWRNNPRSEYSLANTIMWRQILVSSVFVGIVAVLTKLITNIFI